MEYVYNKITYYKRMLRLPRAVVWRDSPILRLRMGSGFLSIAVLCSLWTISSCGDASAPALKASNSLLSQSNLFHGHVPTYKSSHPSQTTTVHNIKWPLCFGKHSAILGSFCVPASTKEQEKKPKTRLPRLSVEVATVGGSEASIFFFDDEDDAWANFRKDSYTNKSCSTLEEYASAVVHPSKDSSHVVATRSLKGKEPHLWYVVAVDCKLRTCPNVSTANVTYFHPTSDGSREACAADSTSFQVLKGAMVEGWQALSLRNVLNISGVSPFGVVLLYLTFLALTFLALWFAWRIRGETELAKRELVQASFYLASLTALCYLTMATGNGLFVLRKVGGGRGAWAYSSAVMATRGDPSNPNPFYDAKYAAARTYPFFAVRSVAWVGSCGVQLHYMAWLVGLPPANRHMALFAGTARVMCDLAATAILGGARWVFWLLEVVFVVLVALEVNAMKGFAMRRGKLVTASYERLRLVALGGWGLGALLWLPCAGFKAFSSDIDVAAYGAIDVLTVVFFTTVLVGGAHGAAPAMRAGGVESQRLTEPVGGKVEFSGAGVGGDLDDLGDLEDNL